MKRQRIGIVFLLVFAWGGLMGCGQELIKEGKDYKQRIEQAIWSKDGKQIAFLYSNLEDSKTQAETKYIYLLDIATRQLKEVKHFNNQKYNSAKPRLLDWTDDNKLLLSMNYLSIKVQTMDTNGNVSDVFETTAGGDNWATILENKNQILHLNAYQVNEDKNQDNKKKYTPLLQIYDTQSRAFTGIEFNLPSDLPPLSIHDFRMMSLSAQTRLYFKCLVSLPITESNANMNSVYNFSALLDLNEKKVKNITLLKKEDHKPISHIEFKFMGWKSTNEIVYANETTRPSGTINPPPNQYFSQNVETNTLQSLNFPTVGILNPKHSKLMNFGDQPGLLVIDVKNPVNQIFISYDQLPKGDFNIIS